MRIEGGISKQTVFIFEYLRFCLLSGLKQRRNRRGRQAEIVEDCDSALSRMCPLSERERKREAERQRQGVWPAANVLKKTLSHTHVY